MSGFIPHFIAGNAIFLIGHYAIQRYSDLEMNTRNIIFLYGICIVFSIIPDFSLGLYYAFHLRSHDFHSDLHDFLHFIISPLSIVIFIFLSYLNIIKKKPIWVFGILCIIVHIIMDATIPENGIWI